MTGIRIEDTPEKCKEVIRRFRHILSVSSVKGPYESKWSTSGEERWYLRAYADGKDSLFDQFEAAQRDYAELTVKYGDLLKDYNKLKQQLGLLQEPRPYDAVISPKHDSSRIPSNLG